MTLEAIPFIQRPMFIYAWTIYDFEQSTKTKAHPLKVPRPGVFFWSHKE